MPSRKISELPSASIPLTGQELLPVVQAGVTDKITAADLLSHQSFTFRGVLLAGHGTAVNAIAPGDFQSPDFLYAPFDSDSFWSSASPQIIAVLNAGVYDVGINVRLDPFGDTASPGSTATVYVENNLGGDTFGCTHAVNGAGDTLLSFSTRRAISAGAHLDFQIVNDSDITLSFTKLEAWCVRLSQAVPLTPPPPPPPPPTTEALITSLTAGTPRNDFSGYVGFKLTVGDDDLVVDALGRWILAGNADTHDVILWDVGNALELARVTVDAAGAGSDTFAYMPLGAPVALLADSEYIVASQETSGGDQWYSNDCSVVTTGVATVDGPRFSTSGTSWSGGAGLNAPFVPPNFLYEI